MLLESFCVPLVFVKNHILRFELLTKLSVQCRFCNYWLIDRLDKELADSLLRDDRNSVRRVTHSNYLFECLIELCEADTHLKRNKVCEKFKAYVSIHSFIRIPGFWEKKVCEITTIITKTDSKFSPKIVTVFVNESYHSQEKST